MYSGLYLRGAVVYSNDGSASRYKRVKILCRFLYDEVEKKSVCCDEPSKYDLIFGTKSVSCLSLTECLFE